MKNVIKWLLSIALSLSFLWLAWQRVIVPSQTVLMQRLLDERVLAVLGRDALPLPDGPLPAMLDMEEAAALVCAGDKSCLTQKADSPLPAGVDMAAAARQLSTISAAQTAYLLAVQRVDAGRQPELSADARRYLQQWDNLQRQRPARFFALRPAADPALQLRVHDSPTAVAVSATPRSLREAALHMAAQKRVEVYRHGKYEVMTTKVVCSRQRALICPPGIQISNLRDGVAQAQPLLDHMRNWPISWVVNAAILWLITLVFSRSAVATCLAAVALALLSLQQYNHLLVLEPEGALLNRYLPLRQWSAWGPGHWMWEPYMSMSGPFRWCCCVLQ